jgi:tRNA/rRNA methyltransferase
MTGSIVLDNVTVVLQRPRYPENIGAAVRAALNMGITRLSVVEPENWIPDRVHLLATHAAREAVEKVKRFESLAEAVADMHYVVGTTARKGRHRQTLHSPRKLAKDLAAISRNNRIAVVFGPEDRGLSNEDLRLCHTVLTIPTADFASINLAQSVMIVCYELFTAHCKEPKVPIPRLAVRHELEGMYESLKEILVRISYIQPQNPDYWMDRIRQFCSRFPLRAAEVSIIRGICRQINWYGGKCYEDGRREAESQASKAREKTACD